MSDRRGNGETSRKVDPGLRKTISPSRDAVELSTLLGQHYDWTALQAATKPFRDFANPAEISRQVRAALKGSKLFGPKREARFQELRWLALEEKRGEQVRLRAIAWDFHRLTKLYARHRERIQGLPEAERSAAARALVRAYLDPDPTALQKLEGQTAAQIEKHKAAIKQKRRLQYIAFEMDVAGLKSAPRKPMTKMQFPRSAANPLRAAEEFYRGVSGLYHEYARKYPELKTMDPRVVAAVVLSGTRFVRPDDKMWHSRKAACVGSSTSEKTEGDD